MTRQEEIEAEIAAFFADDRVVFQPNRLRGIAAKAGILGIDLRTLFREAKPTASVTSSEGFCTICSIDFKTDRALSAHWGRKHKGVSRAK